MPRVIANMDACCKIFARERIAENARDAGRKRKPTGMMTSDTPGTFTPLTHTFSGKFRTHYSKHVE